jgi:hypothetical protein
MEGPSLNALVGHEILLLADVFDSSQLQAAVLLAVDEHGIWVENTRWTQNFLLDAKNAALANTAALFLPYSQVRLIVTSVASGTRSDKASLIGKKTL